MASIKIYQNFTPNRSLYYAMTTSEFDLILSSYLVSEFTIENAVLINNVLKIRKPASSINFDNVTYVKEDRDGFIRYYYVESVQYVGGGDISQNLINGEYIYKLNVDLWATYISKATFNDFFVERSNRFCGFTYGKFDNIENSVKYRYNSVQMPRKYINFSPLQSFLFSNVRIVFQVTFQTYRESSVFHNTITTSDTRLFCITPKDCVNSALDADSYPLVYIERAIMDIAKIYGVLTTDSSFNDAYISGIWIVPVEFLGVTDTDDLIGFKFANPNYLAIGESYGTSVGQIYTQKTCRPAFTANEYQFTIDPNYEFYFGTKTAMLDVPRVVNSNKNVVCRIECITKKGGIQIIARCGESQLDITDAFSVGIPTTTGEQKPEEKVARAVQLMGQFNAGAVQAASGQYIAGVLNAVSAVLPRDFSSNAAYKSNGDGLTSWAKIDDLTEYFHMEFPIGTTGYASSKNEQDRAIRYGLIFNQYVSSTYGTSLSMIQTLIQSTPIYNTVHDKQAFIKATCEISGIPLNAIQVIKEAFSTGVRICKA